MSDQERIIIANDHGGVELKNRLLRYLEARGRSVHNMGIDTPDSVDYPDIAVTACREFQRGEYEFGILICGTGIGISISANKVPGIRCALIHDRFTAEMARAHNDANFVAFGGRVDYTIPVEEILATFMDTTPDRDDRHVRRVRKIGEIDRGV
jgi:ribose 5-phosphate isomerase B